MSILEELGRGPKSDATEAPKYKIARIREKLGFGPKNDEMKTLKDDTVEYKEPVDVETEVAALERHLSKEQEADPAGYAADQLEVLKLTPGARSLLDRALDNLAQSNGANIADPDAKLDIQLRAAVVEASGGNLNVLLDSLTAECGIEEAGGVVYSMLFNVLKAAGFIANLDYRRFLDPNGDYELVMYADRREDHSPLEGQAGHQTRAEYLLESFKELYGSRIEVPEDAVPAALEDLRYYFQLLAESWGWDPQRPMPFLFTMELDGTFQPINDAEQALDALEIKRQVSRAKRRDKVNSQLRKAADRARAALARATA